jgi:hypothetical protein
MIGQPQDGSMNQLRGKIRPQSGRVKIAQQFIAEKRASLSSPSPQSGRVKIAQRFIAGKRASLSSPSPRSGRKNLFPQDDSNTLSPVTRALENFSHRVPSTKVLGQFRVSASRTKALRY